MATAPPRAPRETCRPSSSNLAPMGRFDNRRDRVLIGAIAATCLAIAGVLIAVVVTTPSHKSAGVITGGGAASTTTPPPASVAGTTSTVPRPPHFDTPEAAMTYLASAWNRNDQVELDHVTNPAARAELAGMHDEAVNLRLNHCDRRPVGDYVCFFDHDYPAGTSTTLPGGVGHATFLVGPALTPGWYMTVFEGCG